MASQRVLDFGRSDAIAGAGDDVVGAAVEPEIAVVVALRQIACYQPAIGVFIAGRLGVLPVFEHHHRIGTAEGEVADGAGRQGLACVVDDTSDMSGDSTSERS